MPRALPVRLRRGRGRGQTCRWRSAHAGDLGHRVLERGKRHVERPGVGAFGAFGMDRLEVIADVMAIENHTLDFKCLSDTLGANMRLLDDQTADALAVVMLGFGGEGRHGADGRFS